MTWKSLKHPNVLPLVGVTMTESMFAMVSEWMVNGNVNQFVGTHPNADRLGLVGFPFGSAFLEVHSTDVQIISLA